MARVLSPHGNRHLRDAYAQPDLLTDLDGAVWITRILDHLAVPWGVSELIGYPGGESLMRWQFFAQAIQWVSIFLLTRLFPPVLSLNLFVLIGWIATGLAVYVLGRRLSLRPGAAVAAAILVQMLPAMPKMAANYTSYVFICVPIYAVCRAIDVGTEPGRRNVIWLAGVLAFTALFDAYWFYFSLAATALVLALNVRTLIDWLRGGPRWGRLFAVMVVTFTIALPVWLLASLGASPGSSASRSASVESRPFVMAGLRMPWHWFRSSYEGVGIVVGVVGMATIVWLLWRRCDEKATSAAAVAVLMMLLSTRTGFDTPLFRVGSLAELARFVMPGVRFFQRSAIIAEALLCIFAVRGAVALWTHLRTHPWPSGSARWVTTASMSVLAATGVVELAPYDRPISARWDDFEEMRDVLAEVDQPVVLAVPFERHGRAWLEFSMLDDATAVNQLYGKSREDITAVAASRGPEWFASYLSALGVTHLLAITGENRYPTTYEFTEPWFVERATLELDSYGDPREDVVLYEVRAEPVASEGCVDVCRIGTGFDFVNAVNVLREPDATREQGLTGEVIARLRGWWMLDDAIEVQFSLRQLATVRYVVRMGIEVTNPCADQRTVMVERLGVTDTAVLGPDESATLEFDIASDRPTEPAVVSTDGPPCDGGQPEPVTLKVGTPELVPPI